MKALITTVLMLITGVALAAGTTQQLRFSDQSAGGSMPSGWKHYQVSGKKKTAPVNLVADGNATVLHIDANHDAGAIMHPLDLSPKTLLSWRWKIDHVVAKANLEHKDGDDFAARVYVLFDVPRSELSFGERIKLSLARHAMGTDLPNGALCYVWDNSHPVGTIAPNAYFGAVRTVVLETGNAKAGHWQGERRDLAADFRAAFGRAAPKVTGIVLASDTDNTGGHTQAWFGDLKLTPSPPSRPTSVIKTKETSR